MSTAFSFQVSASDGAARTGQIVTPHGKIRTPAFMPVGTGATVKAMYADQVHALGSDVVLGNTYHLMLRPGAERVAELGGLHKFMQWPHAILTDSGGFQVMSLAKLRRLDESGVTFQSHIDGSTHVLTPERSMEIQRLLGADIQMQFDECVKLPCSDAETERAMRLSLRWAERSKAAFGERKGRALFGIVQGGANEALRIESARALTAINFDGYSIGGLAVGEPQDVMLAMIESVIPHLPRDKPRYLMGVGTPDDMIGAVARGIDMFDCVIPTRGGRTARAYTSRGVFNLRNARFADDPRPLDPACACPGCIRHSRAYLHHLFRAEEMLGPMLLTWHNLTYYQDLIRGLRTAIIERRLVEHAASVRAGWVRDDG